jgi:hypothetical protein
MNPSPILTHTHKHTLNTFLRIHRNLAIYKLYDFKNSGILLKEAMAEAEAEEVAAKK